MAEVFRVPVRVKLLDENYVRVFVDAYSPDTPVDLHIDSAPDFVVSALRESSADFIVATASVSLDAPDISGMSIVFDKVVPVPADAEFFSNISEDLDW